MLRLHHPMKPGRRSSIAVSPDLQLWQAYRSSQDAGLAIRGAKGATSLPERPHNSFAMAMGGGITLQSTAFAQEYWGTWEQQAVCTPDVWRLCSAQVPDVGRIVACLRRNTEELSGRCPRFSRKAIMRPDAVKSRLRTKAFGQGLRARESRQGLRPEA
jgi:hypothetical protein